MTAGRGIVHSERTGDEERAKETVLHGIQSWIALPQDYEDIDPSFEHYPAETLPIVKKNGVKITLISGEAFGEKSSVKTLSPQFYAEIVLDPGAGVEMPSEYPERAAYVVEGEISIGGETFHPGEMTVLCPGKDIRLKAVSSARIMVLGGAPIDGERHIWWNFVSSSQDKIEAAKEKWKSGGFDKVPGETEFIPLPELPG